MDYQLDYSTLGLPESFNYTKKFDSPLVESDNMEIGQIMEAPIMDPSQFGNIIKQFDGQEKKIMDFNKGTTTLAFVFKEGVIVAVDSRASQGNLDASEAVRKVIEVNDFLLATMAGGAADCQFWETLLGVECRKYELRHGERVSVAAASRILVNIIYNYRNYGLSMGCMLAGYDKAGPHLYYLDNDGTRCKGNLFSVGSGSLFAYGVLDTFYDYNMSLDQAVDLGKRAIYHATYRDAASGGVVRVYHVHKNGWTKIIEGKDVNELHYEYSAQKGLDGQGDFAGQKLL